MPCDAFVLGGGGVLGAAEVGMARALLEAGVRPDLVCGTSVGAINGAAIAADPTPEGAHRLLAIWGALAEHGILDGSLIRRVAGVARRRTSLHGNGALRRILRDRLRSKTFEDLAVPFECVAASIEHAREHTGIGEVIAAEGLPRRHHRRPGNAQCAADHGVRAAMYSRRHRGRINSGLESLSPARLPHGQKHVRLRTGSRLDTRLIA